jgi:hypothetical protein
MLVIRLIVKNQGHHINLLKSDIFYRLTYQNLKCFNIQNCPTGISDCHNIISVPIKGDVPVQKRQIITYKSYKMLILIALIVILPNFADF